MAEETRTLQGINWKEAFSVTQIFRAFRVAIHPTKLILALAALFLLYAGGRALDMIWPASSRAIYSPGEITEVAVYEQYMRGGRNVPTDQSFSEIRKEGRKGIEERYAAKLVQLEVEKTLDDAKKVAAAASKLGDVKAKLIDQYKKAVDEATKVRDEAAKARDEAVKNAGSDADKKKKAQEAYAKAVEAYAKAEEAARERRNREYEQAKTIKGQGVFIQFFEYQIQQVNNVVWAVQRNDWLTGVQGALVRDQKPGVFASLKNFFVTGPLWLFTEHTTFCVLFVLLFSIVWAVFGGAISRIAAVHVARDEKISLGSAVRFSSGKFLSFIFAPIIPLMIVLVVGLIVALGGLVGNIPWVGPILMGVLFFLALAAGFVMTLVLLGTLGGFNLMYPTIAVEGSDSFDAISRSFSYVYARPWRMVFYTLVALVYGALCYFFVRFFLWLMLVLTHYFVGKGMMVNVDGRTPADLWNVMWPPPGSRGFTYEIDTMTMHWDQSTGAGLVAFWVYLTIGMLGAYAISFYFSANTIIYYLMRREVDATELDDVYLEQTEEDFGEPAPAGAPAPAQAAAPAAAPETPAPATDTPPAPPSDAPPPQA